MNKQIRTIRISLIVVFILITIGTFSLSVYQIWITAFGIGWMGGEITIIQLIWIWKGIVLITIYSLISCVGLVKKKKIGIIFGYTIPFGFLAHFFIDYRAYGWNSEFPFTLNNLFLILLFLGAPILILSGLTKVKNALFKFKISEYIASWVLILILFLSFYFML